MTATCKLRHCSLSSQRPKTDPWRTPVAVGPVNRADFRAVATKKFRASRLRLLDLILQPQQFHQKTLLQCATSKPALDGAMEDGALHRIIHRHFDARARPGRVEGPAHRIRTLTHRLLDQGVRRLP